MDDRQASAQVAVGARWLGLLRPSFFLIDTAHKIILARLLLPREHGLFGIAVVASLMVSAFSNSGFNLALVRRRESVESYLNTAWTIAVGLGAACATILFLLAPAVAALVEQPAALPYIRAYALIQLVTGLRSAALVELQRRFDFKRWYLIQIVGPLADLAVSVAAALAWRNAWALMAGAMAGATATTLASFLLLSWRPTFELDLKKARELFHFGRWIMASSSLKVLFHQADDLVVARMLGVTALGHYRRAYGWANLPAHHVIGVTTTLGPPLFARLQDQPAKLLESLRQMLRWVALFTFPSLLAIVVLAPGLVGPVLGAPWIPMIPAFRILAIWGILRSLVIPFVSVLQAMNRPDLVVRALLVKVVLFAVVIVPLTSRWGLMGTATAVVLATGVELPLLFRYVLQRVRKPAAREAGTGRMLLQDPVVLAGCAGLMAGAMATILYVAGPAPGLAASLATTAVAAAVGVGVLALATKAADRYLGLGIWAMVREQVTGEHGPPEASP